MDNALLVHVINRFQNLSDQVGRVLLRVRAFLDDSIEELASRYSAKWNERGADANYQYKETP